MRACEKLDEIFTLQDQRQLGESLTLSHKRVVYVPEDTVEKRRLRGRQVPALSDLSQASARAHSPFMAANTCFPASEDGAAGFRRLTQLRLANREIPIRPDDT